MELQNRQEEEPLEQIAALSSAAADSRTLSAPTADLHEAREIVASVQHSHDRTMKAAGAWMLLPPVALSIYAAICYGLESAGMPATWHNGFIDHIGPLLTACLVFTIVPPLLTALISIRRSANARSAVEAVRDARQVSDVGLLVDALQIEAKPVQRAAADALRDLLPKVTEQNSHLLTMDQRRYLIRLLHMNPEMFLYKDAVAVFGPAALDKPANKRSIDLRVAILNAYREIGGALELPIVRRLAGLPHVNTPARKMLNDAAREALPFVEARVERLAKGDTLLRPSEGEEASLLRAAHPTDDTPGDLLLRPVPNGVRGE